MSDMKAVVMRRSQMTNRYLSGVQFFGYGRKVSACYEPYPHMAMPLTNEQACALLPLLKEQFPPSSFRWDDLHEIPPLKLEIVDYPLRKEVPGDV